MDRISILEEAFYVVKYKATLRETAKVFNCSKSKIYKDMTIHLKKDRPYFGK